MPVTIFQSIEPRGAMGMPPFNVVLIPLDNTCSPGTPLDAQYASARRLRYMLPVQMKWMVISGEIYLSMEPGWRRGL